MVRHRGRSLGLTTHVESSFKLIYWLYSHWCIFWFFTAQSKTNGDAEKRVSANSYFALFFCSPPLSFSCLLFCLFVHHGVFQRPKSDPPPIKHLPPSQKSPWPPLVDLPQYLPPVLGQENPGQEWVQLPMSCRFCGEWSTPLFYWQSAHCLVWLTVSASLLLLTDKHLICTNILLLVLIFISTDIWKGF